MDPARHARVKELFISACDLEPSKRSGFLAAECGDDVALRAEVDALLAHMTESPTQAGPLSMPDVEPIGTGTLVAGRYLVESLIGAGGMGRVYRANQLALSRPVALKVLAQRAVASPDALVRFEREAASVARLRHPNIVTVYDAGSDEHVGAFYAMELVEGRSLAEEIAANVVLPLAEAVEVMRQVASAVGAAHKAGVIHRDLKPANVVLDRSSGLAAKVLDFGIAKLVDDGSTTSSHLTESGSVFGTPLYMSPEQARAEPVDARTDVWSLGVILYELVSGTSPFRGRSPAETFVAILKDDPEPLDRAASGVPEPLARLVDRALRKNPAARLATASELEQALARIAADLEQEAAVETIQMSVRDTAEKHSRDGEPETAPPAPPPSEPPPPALAPPDRAERRSWRKLAILAAAIALVLLAGGVLGARFMTRTPPSPASSPAVAAPVATRALEYAVVVQKYRDGAPYEEPFRLAKEVVFEKDYRIRLLVSSPDRGSLYVLNEAPPDVSAEPLVNVLFPSPTSNGGTSELAPGVEVQFPERGWLRFDEERGTETVWLVWSDRPIAELEALTRFVNPKDRGAISDATTARAVRDFLAASARPVEAVRDDARKTTALRAPGGVLVYKLQLEHQ